MQKHPLIWKCLAITVIFLFIGVALAPTINFNVVKATTDNELIEITSEACGIAGFGNHTVKLTRQQYQDLERYLIDFRERLNKTTTREKAIPVFNDAVVELDKYGLLPKGMNIDQAQNLVTGGHENSKLANFIEKKYIKNLEIINNSNFFCLIAGSTKNTQIIHPIGMTLNRILISSFNIENMLDSLFPFSDWKMIHYICGLLEILIYLNLVWLILPEKIPLGYGHGIALGYCYVDWDGYILHPPASGSITTFGLLGKKTWDGEMYGQIRPYQTVGEFYIGATGFKGLKIQKDDSWDYTYFGFTRYIHIGYDVPDFFGV